MAVAGRCCGLRRLPAWLTVGRLAPCAATPRVAWVSRDHGCFGNQDIGLVATRSMWPCLTTRGSQVRSGPGSTRASTGAGPSSSQPPLRQGVCRSARGIHCLAARHADRLVAGPLRTPSRNQDLRSPKGVQARQSGYFGWYCTTPTSGRQAGELLVVRGGYLGRGAFVPFFT